MLGTVKYTCCIHTTRHKNKLHLKTFGRVFFGVARLDVVRKWADPDLVRYPGKSHRVADHHLVQNTQVKKTDTVHPNENHQNIGTDPIHQIHRQVATNHRRSTKVNDKRSVTHGRHRRIEAGTEGGERDPRIRPAVAAVQVAAPLNQSIHIALHRHQIKCTEISHPHRMSTEFVRCVHQHHLHRQS